MLTWTKLSAINQTSRALQSSRCALDQRQVGLKFPVLTLNQKLIKSKNDNSTQMQYLQITNPLIRLHKNRKGLSHTKVLLDVKEIFFFLWTQVPGKVSFVKSWQLSQRSQLLWRGILVNLLFVTANYFCVRNYLRFCIFLYHFLVYITSLLMHTKQILLYLKKSGQTSRQFLCCKNIPRL